MLLLSWNCNSVDQKVAALYELTLFLVDQSGDRVYSSHDFYSRFLSANKMPATLMRILNDDG